MAFACARFSGEPGIIRAAANNPPLREGTHNEAVRVVQLALIDLGFRMPISTAAGATLPDGIFGHETAAVVRDFQRANGLTVDAVVGTETLARLDQLLSVRSVTVARADALQGRKGTGRG